MSERGPILTTLVSQTVTVLCVRRERDRRAEKERGEHRGRHNVCCSETSPTRLQTSVCVHGSKKGKDLCK